MWRSSGLASACIIANKATQQVDTAFYVLCTFKTRYVDLSISEDYCLQTFSDQRNGDHYAIRLMSRQHIVNVRRVQLFQKIKKHVLWPDEKVLHCPKHSSLPPESGQ